jgi:hypothetical protein
MAKARAILAYALALAAGCGGGGGSRDAAVDAARDAPAEGAALVDAPADTTPDAPEAARDAAVDVPRDAAPAAVARVRTYVFHEVSALQPEVAPAPVLSGDGKVIAFVQSGDHPNHVFVMNADGTGLREVDSWDSGCACQARVDVTGDGAAVVSSDGVRIRYARGDGTAARTLVALEANDIGDFRITDDGKRVFFAVRRDARLAGAGMPLVRGLYAMDVSGAGRAQIVGAAAVAAPLGMAADGVTAFSVCGPSLDVSRDGARLVFGAVAAGEVAMAVNGDGTGLHEVARAAVERGTVQQLRISGDGSTVGYAVTGADGAPELYAAAFDGGGRRLLAASGALGRGDVCGGRARLSGDGARLFLADAGLLFDTRDGAALALSIGSAAGDWLVSGAMPGGSMSRDGTRFAFLARDATGLGQIATMDVASDPPLGAAPAIAQATLTPSLIARGAAFDRNTVTARITAPGTLRAVSATFTRNGLRDDTLASPALADDGSNGDLAAGDGVHASDHVSADAQAAAGPRTLRVRAESVANGRRHATVVELSGVAVE